MFDGATTPTLPTGGAMTSPDLVNAKGIRKRFGATEVLRGIDFSVRPGEVHALLGGNGAGKSTLIKIVTGSVQRDSGSLEIDGQPREIADRQPVSTRVVAVVHQEMALLPHLSVAENIALPQVRGAFRLTSAKAAREQAYEALSLIDASFAATSLDTQVAALSLHERQFVEIARTLASGARLLMLDEPTANLTAPESQRLFEILRRLVGTRSIGVVFVSHRMREIREIADVCSILRNGMSVVDRLPLAELSDADIVERMGQGDVREDRRRERRATAAMPTGVPALRLSHGSLTLDIAAGTVLGLAGAPAGPSALIDQLVGVRTGPAVWSIDGAEGPLDTGTPGRAIRAGVGYVSGDRAGKGLLHSLPIIDNLMASRRVLERRIVVDSTEPLEAQRLMDELQIKGTIWQAPGTLSGGTQQKLLIARWTHLRPAVLVLEEPTRGVDIGTKRDIYALIRALAARGTTVVWWSTESVELLEVCDTLLAFDPDGAPTEVLPSDGLSDERLAAATGMAA